MYVNFLHWETHEAVGEWSNATHWVPLNEQVWFNGTRYQVVRVEHQNQHWVTTFVREMR